VPLIDLQFDDSKKAGGFKQFSKAVLKDGEITQKELLEKKYEKSTYNPDDDEKTVRSRILTDFMRGVTNMWTPRVEFNDLSVIQRMMVDQQSWNTYQPNNGQWASADDIQSWRSHAMRPIVRNKCVSVAAHATARLIFPKVFAQNENADDERDAAQVMEDLMEWAADKSNYKYTALRRTIAALTDPASIGYTEFAEAYRRVKGEKKNGKWEYIVKKDETLSGFQDYTVPVDELYIENFYEPDIQKQGFLIWRRVISYDLAKAKYGALYPKFNEHIKPGVQTVYSDANQSFYFVYDPNMRQYDVEEIIYFNKSLDVKIIMVNGVIITDSDNANPRLDKLYPFDKFGYELINNRCFYYKSLAFKTQSDADIVNTLYPMIIDGTYLNIMPPMVNIGSEAIGSEVIVPGAVTNLSSPNASLQTIKQESNIRAGMDTLQKVEESLAESSATGDVQQGMEGKSPSTAYEISRLEQNAATVLGLFIQMIAQHVKDFGKLRLGDILQFLTIAEVDKIESDKDLVYQTFLLHDKKSGGSTKTRKIQFDIGMQNEEMSGEDQLNQSYDILKEQGGVTSKTEIYKVNPELFRNLQYMVTVSPDVLNPRSDDLERAYAVETFDRMIVSPVADQEEALRLLLAYTPNTKRDPDKYIAKPQPMMPQMAQQNPQKPNAPIIPNKGLPQNPAIGQM
jgi:hemerythrin superfamily protein